MACRDVRSCSFRMLFGSGGYVPCVLLDRVWVKDMEVTLKITPELSREVPAAPKRIKLRHILPSLVTVFAI